MYLIIFLIHFGTSLDVSAESILKKHLRLAWNLVLKRETSCLSIHAHLTTKNEMKNEKKLTKTLILRQPSMHPHVIELFKRFFF